MIYPRVIAGIITSYLPSVIQWVLNRDRGKPIGAPPHGLVTWAIKNNRTDIARTAPSQYVADHLYIAAKYGRCDVFKIIWDESYEITEYINVKKLARCAALCGNTEMFQMVYDLFRESESLQQIVELKVSMPIWRSIIDTDTAKLFVFAIHGGYRELAIYTRRYIRDWSVVCQWSWYLNEYTLLKLALPRCNWHPINTYDPYDGWSSFLDIVKIVQDNDIPIDWTECTIRLLRIFIPNIHLIRDIIKSVPPGIDWTRVAAAIKLDQGILRWLRKK